MSLVYAGVLSHGPGMTGRAHLVENIQARDALYAALDVQRREIADSGAQALIVVAAEHFANFFMDNMPAFCIGIGDKHEGPIEDPQWLAIPKRTSPRRQLNSLRMSRSSRTPRALVRFWTQRSTKRSLRRRHPRRLPLRSRRLLRSIWVSFLRSTRRSRTST